MGMQSFVALDLGAESGRAMVGRLEGGRLEIEERHRFPTGMINLNGHLHWDIVQHFQEIKAGLRRFAGAERPPESVGIDTWGVDFGLLDRNGELLGLPYGYRDARTRGAIEQFTRRLPARRIYELTGIQFMELNTLFQLHAMVRDRSPLLAVAEKLLFIPDLLNHFLTGRACTEFTFATTSQLYNPRTQGWEAELFDALEIPIDLMQPIVQPGAQIGELLPAVAQEVGLPQRPVVAVASHDTGSAVAAAPAEGRDWAYISSGTWSLMGVESEGPLISEQTLGFNLTNEGGVGGTFRVLKNIAGMWLLQQCRRSWDPEQRTGYAEIIAAAEEAAPFEVTICPDAPDFVNPPDMPEAIAAFCRRTGQRPPATRGGFVRAILEGLALRYRMVLEELRQVYPHPINRLHIIGGGSQNELLSQFAADATGLPVIAGPVEATAIGNVLVQAMAGGEVNSLGEMRRIIAGSFPLRRYEPGPSAEWERAYERFREVAASEESGSR